ncbi:hypothetical protein [Streptomyces sp. NPDC056255]
MYAKIATVFSGHPEAMVALLGHRQDSTPYIRLFKSGVKAEQH